MLEQAPVSLNFPNYIPMQRVGYDENNQEPLVRTTIDGRVFDLPDSIAQYIPNLYQIINDYYKRIKRFEAERDEILHDFLDVSPKFKSLKKHIIKFMNERLPRYSEYSYLTKQDVLNEINTWYNEVREAFDF